MSQSRLMVSLFLMALIVFTPVLRGYAAPSLHSGHASQAATQHIPGKSVCAQSFSIIAYLPPSEDARLPVLMPIEPRVLSATFTALRERPPPKRLSLI